MKMKYLCLCCAFALMLTARAAGQSGQARQPGRDDNSKAEAEAAEQVRRAAQEQRALKLLDQVVADSGTLKVPENRIHILSVASGVLWRRDEKRARELLKAAADTLSSMLASVDLGDPAAWNELSQFSQTRNELFQTALNYDASAALDFLHKTRIPGMAGQEAQLEFDAAWRLASTDPQTALQIAERALASGVTGNLTGLVSQLVTKDPNAGAQLAADILHKIQSDDLAANNQSFWVAMGMIQPALQAAQAQAAAEAAGTAGTSNRLLLPPADLSALINRVVSTSLKLARNTSGYNEWQTGRNALTQIQSMLPQIEKVDPELSAKLGVQISAALKVAPSASNPNAVFQNLVQTGTPDDLIKAAGTAPPGVREQYYQQAAWKAMNQNDTDKAAEIINENYTDPMARQQMLDQIQQRSVWKAINEDRIDEARVLIRQIRSREQRFQSLVNLANQVVAKGDKKKAVGLLDEARAELPDIPENYQQVSLLLNLSGNYSAVDPSRGIQVLNGIASLLGRLIPAGEALEGFDIQSTFKYGEILMQPRSQLGGTIVQFAEQLGNLATSDYDDAIKTADGAGRPELRMMGELSIASRTLNELARNEQNRPPSGRQYSRLMDLRR
jgi:tetratricopeptide (TPR) repeat protein